MDYLEVIPHLLEGIGKISNVNIPDEEAIWKGECLCLIMKEIVPSFNFDTLIPTRGHGETLILALEECTGKSRDSLNIKELDKHLKHPFGFHQENKNVLHGVIRLLLGCAVQSERKQDHIKAIMTLSSDTQRVLMVEIESIMGELATMEDATPLPLKENLKAINTPIADEVDVKSMNKRLTRENNAIRQENQELNDENKSMREKLDSLETELHNFRQMNAETTLKSEMESQKHALVREQALIQENEEKAAKIESLLLEAQAGQKAMIELKALKDELDIAQEEALKARKLQTSMDKLKQKLEESAGVRNQLLDAQKKVDELVKKNLQFDENVRTISKLSRELESMKKQQTDSDIVLCETKSLLKDKEEQIKDLIDQCSVLEQQERLAVKENATLQNDLLQVSGTEEDVHALKSSLGEGLTELNPQVQEEMSRLRTENKRLLGELSTESKEQFEELSRKCDQVERLKEHFETEFRDAKKFGEETNEKLNAATKEVEQISCLNNELTSNNEQLSKTIEGLNGTIEGNNTTICDLENQIDVLSETKSSLVTELRETTTSFESRLEELQQQLQQQCEDYENSLKEQKQTHEQKLSDTMTTHMRELELKDTSHEAILKELEESHQNVLDSLANDKERLEEQSQLLYQELENKFSLFKEQHGVSNDEHKKEMELLIEEKQVTEKKLTQLKAEHEQFVQKATVAIQEKENEMNAQAVLLETRMEDIERVNGVVMEQNEKLKQYEETFAMGKNRLETAHERIMELETDLEQSREEMDRFKSQLKTIDRKLQQSKARNQTLQLQHSETARKLEQGGGSQAQELHSEVKRLLEEKQQMTNKIERLHTKLLEKGGGAIAESQSQDQLRFTAIVRNLEQRNMELEKEKNTISLGRTNEMSLRMEAEKKASKLSEELENVKAQMIQAQLEVERARILKRKSNASETSLYSSPISSRISQDFNTDVASAFGGEHSSEQEGENCKQQ